MSTHALKLRQDWFERVASGQKLAEVRLHDRDFQAGDRIEFIQVDGTGNPIYAAENGDGESKVPKLHARILHVLTGVDGLSSRYCVLSIRLDPTLAEMLGGYR